MNLNQLTLKQAKEGLRNKSFSSVELTKAHLTRIQEVDERLNAFITVTEKEALKKAAWADAQIAADSDLPLLGIPIALKDVYSTQGIKTTAGSYVLESYVPPFDATAVKKIKDGGAVIIGKANCDAWAHGSSGENSDFGPTKNPWNLNYVPGGSSSGSAVSVAAGMAIAASGTDTGGSIRLPASFTNTVGLKPTYGRVSRYGIIAMASSMDSIGHFTKTVEDSAIFLNVTAGHDPLDATTPKRNVPDYTKKLNNEVKNFRIGVDPEFYSDHIESENLNLLTKAYNTLKHLVNSDNWISDIPLPHSKYANACYYILQPAEVSSNLGRYDGIRYGFDRAKFGAEAKRRIMLGTYTLSSGYYDRYYHKALKIRSLLVEDFQKAFEKVDVIIAPVSPTPPWKLGEKVNDPLKMYLSDVFTVTANLAGIPALSIPIGFTKNGLPVGMQILGPHFSEEKLFQIGHAFEQATQKEDWRAKKPNL